MASGTIKAVVSKSDIVNNLTTSTTGKVLDASQGKALKDSVDTKITDSGNDNTSKIASMNIAYSGGWVLEVIDKAGNHRKINFDGTM